MTRPCRRRKVKNPGNKVSRRNRVVKHTATKEKVLQPHWDPKSTVEQNFKQLGLVRHVNHDITKPETFRRLKDWNWKRSQMVLEGEVSEYDTDDDVIQELDTVFGPRSMEGETSVVVKELEEIAKTNMAASKVKKERPLSEYESTYIKRLIEKYGDDFDKMFMDIKLNVQQMTSSQLRKLADIFHAQQ